jgi:hypothetical protein
MLALSTTVQAADYTVAAPVSQDDDGEVRLQTALSHTLALDMVRATFDVIAREDLKDRLQDEARRWGGAAPSPETLADIDRQLLAEASYYLVSLSYVVQVGGAAFPADKTEAVYANDTLVRIDSLQRQLVDAIADGGDVLPILSEAEDIRALTEGYTSVPDDFGVFNEHAAILAEVAAELAAGVRT